MDLFCCCEDQFAFGVFCLGFYVYEGVCGQGLHCLVTVLALDFRHNTKIQIHAQRYMRDSLKLIPIMAYLNANQYLNLILIIIFL